MTINRFVRIMLSETVTYFLQKSEKYLSFLPGNSFIFSHLFIFLIVVSLSFVCFFLLVKIVLLWI